MRIEIKIIKGEGGSMFSHLSSRTVLLGLATMLVGGYYWAEDLGLVSMYIPADILAKAMPLIGAATWFLRVNAKANVGASGRITPEDMARIEAELREKIKAETEPKP